MKAKRANMFLVLIFVLTFTFQIAHSLQSESFTGSASYDSLSKVSFMIDKDFDTDDTLGNPSLFHYILSVFSLILPIVLVGKIIPPLLSSFLIIIVYHIARKISKNRRVSLLAAFMSGFIPVYTSLTLNSVSSYSLAIPLFFLTIFFFIRSEEKDKNKDFTIYFIIAFIASLLTHPITLLLILILIVYLVITSVESLEVSMREKEIIIFSTFFALWVYFLIFKNAIMSFGPEIIWNVVPTVARTEYFLDFNILLGIVGMGLIPFLFGIYVVYSFFLKQGRKMNYLYISIVLCSIIILWLRIIPLKVGLSILAVTLILLFSYFFKNFILYLKKTKLEKHELKIHLLIIIIFIGTSVIPCFIQAQNNLDDALDDNEVEALTWIRDNTPEDSIILTSLHEGSAVRFISRREPVADINFLEYKEIDERLDDMKDIYTTFFSTEAIPLLTKYEVDYIILSNRIRDYYGIESIKYIDDENCFKLVFDESVRIYRSLCRIEERRIEPET